MADIFELFKKIAAGRSEPTGAVTHIVVGLGNPGDKYARTRHNTGFLAMDFIAEKYSLGKFCSRFKATVAEGTVDGKRVLFMKPQTYMNNSGEAVREAADFYKIPPEHVVVISDDVNLAPGVVRIRESGSDGGQKGLASIIVHMGTDKIPRIRVGVGMKPRPDYELADWVLGEIPAADREAMFDAFGRVADALPLVLDGKFAEAASRYNGKPKTAEPEEPKVEQTSLPPGGRWTGEAGTEGERGSLENGSQNDARGTSTDAHSPSVASTAENDPTTTEPAAPNTSSVSGNETGAPDSSADPACDPDKSALRENGGGE